MGRLRRSGMIEARSGDNLAINLQLCRGGLRKLATARIRSVEELFGGFLVSAPPPTLRPDDYRPLSPGFDVLERMLRVSLARQHAAIGRAACRERWSQDGYIRVGARAVKKKK